MQRHRFSMLEAKVSRCAVSLLLFVLTGCRESAETGEMPVASEQAWTLDGPHPSRSYPFYTVSQSQGVDAYDVAQILFDNGSADTLVVLLPDDLTVQIPPHQFAVLQVEIDGFRFAVSTDAQQRTEFRPKLRHNGPFQRTYVYNHRAICNYRLEQRLYSEHQLPGVVPRENQEYDERGREWFEVKFDQVDYFFEPLPKTVSTYGGLPGVGETKVCIGRIP